MKIYVQIGANVGDDDFFRKVEESKEKLIIHLIEPNVDLHEKLKNCYSTVADVHKIYIHKFGISNNNGDAVLNIYDNDGLSSLIDRKSHNFKKNSIEIECKHFNNFCDDFNISHIDVLYIDTEGLDYEILKSIDLKRVDIDEICFEYWPYENDDIKNNYRTGDNFLKNEVLPKYVDYNISETVLDDMKTIKLSKNIC